MTGINDLLRRGHEILDKTTDPKMQLQSISVLANLYAGLMSLATDGGVIQAAFDKVELIQEIQQRHATKLSSSEEEKEEPAKITTIDDQDTAPEPEEDIEEEKE